MSTTARLSMMLESTRAHGHGIVQSLTGERRRLHDVWHEAVRTLDFAERNPGDSAERMCNRALSSLSGVAGMVSL